MVKISFVMPTFNRGEIIGKSIQSIIDQTYQDWELIIADNGSSCEDKTEEVVKNFSDSRIKYYKVPEKWTGWIAEARNFGNMLVESPIIAVADSDDIYSKERAELTLQAFEKENCDVFYGQIEVYDERTGELKERNEKYPVTEFSMGKMKEYNLIPHGSSAYKTEIAYDYPYNSFFHIGEDADLFTRLAKAGKKFYFCDKVIYRYVVHGGNVTLGGIKGNYGELIKSNRGWVNINRQEILKKILENS